MCRQLRCRQWRRLAAAGACLAALVVSACGAPPNKEIADAEEALRSARAAGAERYAPDAYAAAMEAYRLANEAVTAADYRLALNHALESRERAQSAGREAADLHTRARDEVHRSMADVATLLARAAAQIDEAERVGLPRQVIRAAHEAVAQVNDDVQEAGAAVRAENYAEAEPVLIDVTARLTGVVTSLEEALAAQSRKQR
jgi:hypothetical protein